MANNAAAQPKRRGWLWSIVILVVLTAGIGVAAIVLRGPSVEKYLADGRKQLENREYKSAVISFKNAVRSDANNAMARLALAEASLRVGDLQAAEKEAKMARQLGADEALTIDLLAQALFVQGKYEDMLREVAPGERGPKVEALVRIWRGYAYIGQRDRNLARASFTEAIKVNPEEPRGYVGLARTSVESGNLKQAEEEIDRALETAPKLAEALAMKGELQRMSGRRDEALQSFNAAIESDPRTLLALIGRAVLALDSKQDADAERDAKAVLAIAPAHPIGNYVFALITSRRGDIKTALERLERLGGAISSYPPSIYLMATLQYRSNQFAQAEANFERYLAVVPRDIRARQLLADLYMRRNANERAIEVLKLAVDTGANDAQTFGMLASAYLRDRQFQEASKWFDRAAQLPATSTQQQLQLAFGRMQLGQSEEAIKEIEEAIEQDPTSVQARMALALGHLRAGDYRKALQAADDLRLRQPDNPVPLNVMGTIHVARGSLQDAKLAFEAALKVKPDFLPAQLNLAAIEGRTGNQAKAIEGYKAVLQNQPNSVEANVGMAQISVQQNKPAEAITWLEKARTADPRANQPAMMLIDLYMRDGKPDRAIQVARDLQGRNPDNPQALDTLARTQLAIGETASAVQTFRQVVNLTPRVAEAHYRLGKALQSNKDETGAVAAFRQAQAIDANYAPALLELIEADLRNGRNDAAEKMAADWSRARPTVPAGFVIYGDTLMKVNKPKEAVAVYERAQAQQPSSPIAIRLANAHKQTGDNEKAIAVLQTWVNTRPEDNVARFALADLYMLLQRHDPALVHYEYLLKSEPKNPVLLNNVAWIYGERGDPRAIQYAEDAFKAAPNSPFVEDTLGLLHVQKGDLKKGIEHLRNARNKAPTSGEIAYHLAIGLAKAGDKEEAKALLKEATSTADKFADLPKAQQLLKELGGS